MEQSASYQDFESSLKELVELYEETVRPLTADEKRRIFSDDGGSAIKKSAMVRAIAHHGPEVQARLNSIGLGILMIKKPKKSFVIGSMPLVRLGINPRSYLERGDVEIWLPVATDIAISPISVGRDISIFSIPNDQWLRDFNESIFDQSMLVGSISRELLESLACRR